ncbi:hypothetical protein QAD02_002009 [Eretmocerus hayati]|uniref:Uncharacterized protein n=1 Tax=Eretmocerus hayati TaxID=131215 RepID=A0ACC2NHP8_9HYME|nr:hypothetical protein QAD02_002009 [Eretmocerus hayati]
MGGPAFRTRNSPSQKTSLRWGDCCPRPIRHPVLLYRGPHLRHQRSPASAAYRATPPLALAAAQRPSASATLLAGAQKLTAPDPAQQQLLDLLVYQTIQHSVPMQPLDTVRPAETRPPFLV